MTVVVGSATGGTFTLDIDGTLTTPIAWNATALEVETAVSVVSAATVTGTGATVDPWIIVFTLAPTAVTPNFAGLTQAAAGFAATAAATYSASSVRHRRHVHPHRRRDDERSDRVRRVGCHDRGLLHRRLRHGHGSVDDRLRRGSHDGFHRRFSAHATGRPARPGLRRRPDGPSCRDAHIVPVLEPGHTGPGRRRVGRYEVPRLCPAAHRGRERVRRHLRQRRAHRPGAIRRRLRARDLPGRQHPGPGGRRPGLLRLRHPGRHPHRPRPLQLSRAHRTGLRARRSIR